MDKKYREAIEKKTPISSSYTTNPHQLSYRNDY